MSEVKIMQLQEVFSQAEEISVLKNGAGETYAAGTEKFEEIVAAWNGMLEGSIVMPAFGVSLNEHTLNAMKNGVWVEFGFGEETVIGEMPFEKLLVEVRPEYKGFNVIRYMQNCGYSGRCYYIDLREGDMSGFYNYLSK